MFFSAKKKIVHCQNYPFKPLFLSSSGGGGHLSSMDAIMKGYDEELRQALVIKNNWKRNHFLELILWVQEYLFIKYFINCILNFFAFPEIPDKTLFFQELEKLNKPYLHNQDTNREYIDVLLDICDNGFYHCAYWNVFQKKDDIENIQKMIQFFAYNESINYKKIKTYIFNMLEIAMENRCPYTEIVSSQPLGLAAICDAIDEYQQKYAGAPKIKLKQYLTDLPSLGCKHYFQGLQKLNQKQSEKIELFMLASNELYGLDNFNIHYIEPKNNAMVRDAFKNLKLDNFHQDISVKCFGLEEELLIQSNETTACVMLGSNASDATIKYVEKLIHLDGIDKVFVFTASNQSLVKSLQCLAQEKLVILGQQGAETIAPLMARSQYTVIRGGGLSIMEQLSLLENLDADAARARQIFIHHKEGDDESKLTSGIPWEDGNVEYFINEVKAKAPHIKIFKTSPQLFESQIEAIANKALSPKC